jgi:hypothetical protein
MYDLLKYLSGGVSTVTYHNEEGQLVDATSKFEMEEVGMKANTNKNAKPKIPPLCKSHWRPR